MDSFLLVGKWALAASFMLLAFLTVSQWARRRDGKSLYLALAVVLLRVVSLVSNVFTLLPLLWLSILTGRGGIFGVEVAGFQGSEPPRFEVIAQQRDGSWRFAVRDNFIGIPADHRDRIFGLFLRVHTRDEYPGTGIGLVICRRIVEWFGGPIRVDPEAGRGSTAVPTLVRRAAAIRAGAS